MLPVEDMSRDLNQFLKKSEVQSCKKCAYVVPIYEISTNVTKNPRNKSELLELKHKTFARPFHIKVYEPNQGNSDLKKWEKLNVKETLDVAYDIGKYHQDWEPVYVAKADTPPFDERFVGYGYTRNSQVYEMHMSGYQWKVLTNAFLCHRGFQTTKNYSQQRKKQ
ncbi:unnamed protein product, partial [Meganyctiphanes norvegica]